MEINEKYGKLNLEEVIKDVINNDKTKECITGDFTFKDVSEVYSETDYILSLKGKEILMFQKNGEIINMINDENRIDEFNYYKEIAKNVLSKYKNNENEIKDPIEEIKSHLLNKDYSSSINEPKIKEYLENQIQKVIDNNKLEKLVDYLFDTYKTNFDNVLDSIGILRENNTEKLGKILLELDLDALIKNDIVQKKSDEQLRYEKEIKDAINNLDFNSIEEQNEIKVCDTPKILIDCGMKQLPMLYRKGHLRDALEEKDSKKHYHGLTIEQIYNLPNNITEPALIIRNKDENKQNCPILVLNDFDSDKLPIFVVIEMNSIGTYELKNINTNDILSMYGRKNFENYFENVINANGLIYYDKQKVHNLDTYCGLQLSTPCINYEPNVILQQINKKVNRETEFLLLNIDKSKIIDVSIKDDKDKIIIDTDKISTIFNNNKTDNYVIAEISDNSIFREFSEKEKEEIKKILSIGGEEKARIKDYVLIDSKYKLDIENSSYNYKIVLSHINYSFSFDKVKNGIAHIRRIKTNEKLKLTHGNGNIPIDIIKKEDKYKP